MQLLFKNKFLLVILICLSFFSIYFLIQHDFSQNSSANSEDTKKDFLEDLDTILDIKNCGDSLGSFNGITAFYNAGFSTCDNSGRHQNQDGYVYGKKWQCVEYVRRYYKDALNHEMPEYWGHASDYFREAIPSGSMNLERDLLQYHNGDVKPQENDILIWPGAYGHVAIITNVTDTTVSTIAQNVGENCTEILSLNEYTISGGCVGLLRKKTSSF